MIQHAFPRPPDALTNLVGQQNARYGIIKIFSALQEANANKHLLYVSMTHISNICVSLKQDFLAIYFFPVSLCLLGIDGNVTKGAVS